MKESKCEVRLIGRTQPIEGNTGTTTANELVAYTARVSNPTNQNNNKTASKLVRYLIKHQHWSPFEMVHLTLEIKTTRDISRQILRHRSFAFQEFSQRYAESETFVEREARMQDEKNRQNSLEATDDMIKEIFSNSQSELMDIAERVYRSALNHGIAKEQARALLPEGLTETTLYMAGSLRSWIHYCQLRMGVETQKEHREVAEQCWEIIKSEFPDITDAIDT
jgi:thymidylate synthase (FAD)